MDIFKAFATDESREKKGAACPLGDATFYIARAYNPNFNRVFGKLYKDQKAVIENKGDKEAAEAAASEVLLKAMSETILVGWEGKVEYAGEALEYSPANARKLLAVPDFRVWVGTQSEDVTKFRVVQDEEDEGN